MIKHSRVKLNHCSENSISNKNSRFTTCRKKNNVRLIGSLYFSGLVRIPITSHRKNHKIILTLSVQKSLNSSSAISWGTTVVTKPARGSEIFVYISSILSSPNTRQIVKLSQHNLWLRIDNYVRHRKLPADDSMKSSRTARPPTQYSRCWPAFIAHSADVNLNWWRCSYNLFSVLSIRRLP